MFCSACGNPLRLGARFCARCGTACTEREPVALALGESTRFCPSCGLVQAGFEHFCQHCSACSQCGVRRAPEFVPSDVRSSQRPPAGDRIAARALDVLLIPYAMVYLMPVMPSMQAWWWSLVAIWCGNIVLGNVAGQSMGKRLLHIRVVRAGSNAAPGLARGLLRTAIYALTGGPVGPGALWALADDHGRGWHDLAAGTVVVRDTRRQRVASLEGGHVPAALP